MREELELNREHWNEATRIHTRGNVYGVEDFKAGACLLHRVEVEEVGDVRGKRLLHLQCHFGLDTLSWARRGALVTGVDFAPDAVDAARKLAAECGVPGEFVCGDLYALREALPGAESFDIVYTSHGVLCWLPELARWAEIIAHYLKPGGFFYIVEGHPTARMFPTEEDLPSAGGFRLLFSYFHEPAGMHWPPGADYADPDARNTVAFHAWQHSLGDILNALIGAGLVVEWLHEFPFCAWDIVAGCEIVEPGYYGLPSQPPMPLSFSVRARRPA